jgi:LysM repeat protein
MRFQYIIIFLVLFSILSLAQDKPNTPNDNVSIYVVRPGDSLWKISKNFFNSPVLWPRLWKLNPTIDNPHKIFPGEVINLKQQAPKLPIAKFDPAKKSFTLGDVDPPPPVYYYSLSQDAGFISPDEWEHMGTIVNSEPARILLGRESVAYINVGTNDNVAVGDKYTIFRSSKIVLHPITNKRVGYKVAILGELEVSEVLGEKISTAKITKSNREITRGARIRPAEEFVKEVVVKKGTADINGYIIDNQKNLHMSGMFDVVYFDAGMEDNVVPGNVFTIYQYPRQTKDLDTGRQLTIPKFPIAKMIVLNVQRDVSTGLIFESSRQVVPGDLVSVDL